MLLSTKERGEAFMPRKNYKLTFEKYFQKSSDLDCFEIMEFSEVFKNSNVMGQVVPSHVDDAEKDVSEGGVIRYKKKNVLCENGNLVLKATCQDSKFIGSMVKCSTRKFGNGYFEIKAKYPPFTPGVWPRMTIKAGGDKTVTEIDFAQVMGIRGKNACTLSATYLNGTVCKNINYLYSPNNVWPRYYPEIDSPELLSEGFHILGFEKTDRDVVFSVDGIVFSRIDIDNPVFECFKPEGELILSVGVGYPRIEAPTLDTFAPCEMQIEYIKFYEEVK